MEVTLTHKLPHYSRFFSAYFSQAAGWVILWSVFIGIITVNIGIRTKMTVPDRFKVAAMLNPHSGETHLKLARLYFINGDPSSADRETQLAIQLSEVSGNPNYSVLSESVLGASSGPTNGLSGLRDEITRQLSAYAFWKSIASDKPDYVSAQIATASYAYMLGKYTEADNFLSNALSLDPTNPEVVSLADQIKTR